MGLISQKAWEIMDYHVISIQPRVAIEFDDWALSYDILWLHLEQVDQLADTIHIRMR